MAHPIALPHDKRTQGINFLSRSRENVWRRIKEFSALGGDATYLVPRWIALRTVGIVFAVVFTGIISESAALIGPRGLVPLAGFFAEWQRTYPDAIEAFLRAPSLFWLNSSPGMITTLAWGGLAAAIALILNLWPRIAL